MSFATSTGAVAVKVAASPVPPRTMLFTETADAAVIVAAPSTSTSSVAPGTVPEAQLPAVWKSFSTAPVHCAYSCAAKTQFTFPPPSVEFGA